MQAASFLPLREQKFYYGEKKLYPLVFSSRVTYL